MGKDPSELGEAAQGSGHVLCPGQEQARTPTPTGIREAQHCMSLLNPPVRAEDFLLRSSKFPAPLPPYSPSRSFAQITSRHFWLFGAMEAL